LAANISPSLIRLIRCGGLWIWASSTVAHCPRQKSWA